MFKSAMNRHHLRSDSAVSGNNSPSRHTFDFLLFYFVSLKVNSLNFGCISYYTNEININQKPPHKDSFAMLVRIKSAEED